VPEITALIGTWNYAHTLPRAIDSLLSQTVEDLEVLVVDDGSTDATQELMKSLDDPRIRYEQRPHRGIAATLNDGVAEARAPYVAVQDADDWSLPGRLERQLSVLRARPEVAVVGSRMREVDEHGRELRPRTMFAPGDVGSKLLRYNPVPNTSAAFRRDVFLELGGYDARYRYAMEYELWMRIAEHHVVHAIDEVLSVRVMHGGNQGAGNERAQMREMLRLQVEALRRRRTLRGAGWLAVPALSLLTPQPLKRALRRRLGQAP
jgi:glycosyltransferase involved in cell wall biosynthesis